MRTETEKLLHSGLLGRLVLWLVVGPSGTAGIVKSLAESNANVGKLTAELERERELRRIATALPRFTHWN